MNRREAALILQLRYILEYHITGVMANKLLSVSGLSQRRKYGRITEPLCYSTIRIEVAVRILRQKSTRPKNFLKNIPDSIGLLFTNLHSDGVRGKGQRGVRMYNRTLSKFWNFLTLRTSTFHVSYSGMKITHGVSQSDGLCDTMVRLSPSLGAKGETLFFTTRSVV